MVGKNRLGEKLFAKLPVVMVTVALPGTLTAVLGREAGYRGGEVTFADLLKAGTKLEPDLTGVRD